MYTYGKFLSENSNSDLYYPHSTSILYLWSGHCNKVCDTKLERFERSDSRANKHCESPSLLSHALSLTPLSYSCTTCQALLLVVLIIILRCFFDISKKKKNMRITFPPLPRFISHPIILFLHNVPSLTPGGSNYYSSLLFRY